MELHDVKWRVVTIQDQTFFALTAKDYERLALDRAELLRYVKESKWRLDYYGAGDDRQ